MKIFARILAVLLIVPAIELIALIWLTDVTNIWVSVGLIVFTALLGGYYLKREGLAAWKRFNERLGVGDLPSDELIDGIIILCAGALLLTPGVLTDLSGFAAIFPPSRALIRKQVQKWADKAMQKSAMSMTFGSFGGAEMDFHEFSTPPSYPPEAEWGGTPAEQPRHIQEPPRGAEGRDLPEGS